MTPSLAAEHDAEQQRRSALAEANRVRTRRGKLKRHLREGRTTLAWVLRANKAYVQTMRIGDLLYATPAIGVAKTDRVLRCMGLGPADQLQGITMREREELLRQLAEHYPAAKIGKVAYQSPASIGEGR